jgi:hypothetical protein
MSDDKFPKVRIVSSISAHKKILDRTITHNKSKLIQYFGNGSMFQELFSEDEDYEKKYYIPQRMKRGIKLELLIPRTQMLEDYQDKDKEENRETRVLHIKMENCGFTVYDDTVIIYIYKKKLFAIEIIGSTALANTIRNILKSFW